MHLCIYIWSIYVQLMTEEELRQVDDSTLSAISFGLDTYMVYYKLCTHYFFLYYLVYMLKSLSIRAIKFIHLLIYCHLIVLLQVSADVSGGHEGVPSSCIKKGKVINCLRLIMHVYVFYLCVVINNLHALYCIGCGSRRCLDTGSRAWAHKHLDSG
jgi:hypothetical protein